MLFMPSGINDAKTAAMAAACSTYALADPTDLPIVKQSFATWHIAVDSGGYALFKAGTPITDAMAVEFVNARRSGDPCYPYLLHFALDQIGDHDRTYELYVKFFQGDRFVPIYPWGAPRAHLLEYMHRASMINLPNGTIPLVGIGGLARLFRGGHRVKDPVEKKRLDALRDQTLDAVQELCAEFPATFHILGLNSLPGIERLAPLAASCDSSKWLDGGRYGYMIFKHRKTGKLSQAPAKTIPEYASLDRTQRCCRSLVNLIAASNGTLHVGD